MPSARPLWAGLLALTGAFWSTSARAHPDGAAIVRLLGSRAAPALAPASGSIGALVQLGPGVTAASVGAEPVVPGIGRLRGDAAQLLRFSEAHPAMRLEVAPPLKLLMARVGGYTHAPQARSQYGVDGTGVVVGVADTGIDVRHPAFRLANGDSRVAWLIDLSLKPLGIHPELEERFGIKGPDGKLAAGAVFSGADLSARLRATNGEVPADEVGHGSHVASIAAGGTAFKPSPYAGMAPGATLVIARVTRAGTEAIENDDLLKGVEFMYDRAAALGMPAVINLSVGGDFGPHDGSTLWEQALAGQVGPEHPGRAMVVAAGNSGSIADGPVHDSVHVTGSPARVPILTQGAVNGGVQIWVTLREGANLKIGLDGPDGVWVPPIEEGTQRGKNEAKYNAGVIYGASVAGSPIPTGSRGAVVLWQGTWPTGTYWVTLDGKGAADLWLQGTGDVGPSRPAFFAGGQRQGTINLPADHPGIIAVGCTINAQRWENVAGSATGLSVPLFDAAGMRAAQGVRPPAEGEMCWFSSAGPSVNGVPKPDIAAPGAPVTAAMSGQAKPGVRGSIFTTGRCPRGANGASDPRCLQVDEEYGVSVGTSMSAPVVTGVTALLLQRDPTLTQGKIRALLQAGAHRFRATPLFQDQSGPGEVDAAGSLDALEQMERPETYLPSAATSWITLSSEYAPADNAPPITAILELRTSDGAHRADLFEPSRLAAEVLIDSVPLATTPVLVREGPGLYTYQVRLPSGLGGRTLSLGATFDGQPVVAARRVPVATDLWNAKYAPTARGGAVCGAGAVPVVGSGAGLVALGLALGCVWVRRSFTRRRGRAPSREAPTPRRADRAGTPGPRR